MRLPYAFGVRSLTNACTSSNVGLKPSKSTYARVTSVRLSACGEGWRFFSASFASTKLSILLAGHPWAGTIFGAWKTVTGWNAHHLRPSSIDIPLYWGDTVEASAGTVT